MAIDKDQIRERIRIERVQQSEALGWYEMRRTQPVLTPEQQKAHEEYLRANPNLPF